MEAGYGRGGVPLSGWGTGNSGGEPNAGANRGYGGVNGGRYNPQRRRFNGGCSSGDGRFQGRGTALVERGAGFSGGSNRGSGIGFIGGEGSNPFDGPDRS